MKNLYGLLTVILVMVGCTRTHYVFKEEPPISRIDNDTASALPQKNEFEFREYFIASTIRKPLVESFDFRRTPRSQDVNSLDLVPESTWYTPRLGAREMGTEELVAGPEVIGPPQKPITVLKVKSTGV